MFNQIWQNLSSLDMYKRISDISYDMCALIWHEPELLPYWYSVWPCLSTFMTPKVRYITSFIRIHRTAYTHTTTHMCTWFWQRPQFTKRTPHQAKHTHTHTRTYNVCACGVSAMQSNNVTERVREGEDRGAHPHLNDVYATTYIYTPEMFDRIELVSFLPGIYPVWYTQ